MQNDLTSLARLNDREREELGNAARRILGQVYLIRDLPADEALYKLAIRNFEALECWFGFFDMSLHKDEHLGIVTWLAEGGDRVNLNLYETLAVLVFRLLYEEKRGEISLGSQIGVQQLEFQDRFRVLTERRLSKTRLTAVLRRLQGLKLINLRGEADDPGTLILIYPSIVFCLDAQGVENAAALLVSYAGDDDEPPEDD
ncbi:MAG: DUF4194 domain-containing protein [Spirochaetales bacterium]|jgi:hypothetical protein|nr:DUF4194 domain-containing protein [Spirochaetales bacterium]